MLSQGNQEALQLTPVLPWFSGWALLVCLQYVGHFIPNSGCKHGSNSKGRLNTNSECWAQVGSLGASSPQVKHLEDMCSHW